MLRSLPGYVEPVKITVSLMHAEIPVVKNSAEVQVSMLTSMLTNLPREQLVDPHNGSYNSASSITSLELSALESVEVARAIQTDAWRKKRDTMNPRCSVGDGSLALFKEDYANDNREPLVNSKSRCAQWTLNLMFSLMAAATFWGGERRANERNQGM